MSAIRFLLRGGARTLRVELVATWRGAWQDILDPYRPERHYMRGPGPKWRARHENGAAIAA
jgi:hypothetical protein